MPIRLLTRDDLLDFERIQCISFSTPFDAAVREKQINEAPEPKRQFIGYFTEDGILTAGMALPQYQMMYEGQIVKMVGIAGVASLPEYRHGGAVRQIFEVAFQQMLEDGVVFSSLYPFSHRYYHKFGYELMQREKEYEIPIELLAKFRFNGSVRMLKNSEPLDAIKKVFERHFFRYNMAIDRNDDQWKRLTGSDPLKDQCHTYVLEEDGEPYAYVILHAALYRGERIGGIAEIAFVNRKGLYDLLGFLYRFSAQYKTLRLSLPDDIPLEALLEESYDVKQSKFRSEQMTRVVNLKKALELMRHPENVWYTLRVFDECIPENDGYFSVRSENGEVRVQKLSDPVTADLTMDIRTAAQLLLGYLSLDQAMYKPDIKVNANTETLFRVFTKRPVFLTDHF